jgi:hypothetical protein
MNLSSLNHRRIKHICDLSDYKLVDWHQYFQMNAENPLKLLCHRVVIKSKHYSILSSIETSDVQEWIWQGFLMYGDIHLFFKDCESKSESRKEVRFWAIESCGFIWWVRNLISTGHHRNVWICMNDVYVVWNWVISNYYWWCKDVGIDEF